MRLRLCLPALVAALAAACHGPKHATSRPSHAVEVVVIAPHPDDEALMAAGVMQAALARGQRVAVIVVTNGDFGCFADRNASARQAETVTAMRAIGLDESDVHFLGYPDGYLSRLSDAPLAPVDALLSDGTCGKRVATQAFAGLNHRDEHSRRTGQPATFTAPALTEDLAALLAELSPQHVYVAHGLDWHPDHAATYVFFRRALEQLTLGPVTVHRAMVHAGPCWPTDCVNTYGPDADLPPLPAPLDGYAPTEQVSCNGHSKLSVIARYESQAGTHAQDDWLAGFARRREGFFVERLGRTTLGHVGRLDAARSMELAIADGAQLKTEGGDVFTITVTGEHIGLHRGGQLIAQWPSARIAPPYQLRVEASDAEHGYADWSLWGRGYVYGGLAVLRAYPAAQ